MFTQNITSTMSLFTGNHVSIEWARCIKLPSMSCTSNIASSVASPIYISGGGKVKEPSRFFLFFPNFPDFLPLFPNFWQIFRCQWGTLPLPLDPAPLSMLTQTWIPCTWTPCTLRSSTIKYIFIIHTGILFISKISFRMAYCIFCVGQKSGGNATYISNICYCP